MSLFWNKQILVKNSVWSLGAYLFLDAQNKESYKSLNGLMGQILL